LRDNSAGVPPEEDSDLANAVPTLLLAHAFAQAKPARRVELVHLRLAATHDLSARAVLRELLHSEHVVDAYRADVTGLHRQACQRLGALCPDNEFRAVLRAELDVSARLAIPAAREVIGL
jgi:geranylgeranyl pyrophosphate synthase